MSDTAARWIDLLRHPEIPLHFSEEEIYRAACIGAVMLLYEAADAPALADVVRHGAAPESRSRALLSLKSLTRSEDNTVKETAIHLLHELAVLDGIADAAGFLQKTNLQDKDPGWNSARMLLLGQKHQLLKADPGPEQLSELFIQANKPLRNRLLKLSEKIIPNWHLLMAFIDDQSEEHRNTLLGQFKSFSPDESKLFQYCAQSKDKCIKSMPADLLLQYDDETLLSLCVKNKLLPSESTQEALFYFLSGQWDRYYAADSDYRRIRIAYEQKDPELQRRLITISRDSGNSAWLRDISGSSENSPHGGNLSDQHLFTASLIEQKQWNRLWELLPGLPLLCMSAAVNALHNAAFEPEQNDEKAFFADLTNVISKSNGLSAIPIRDRFNEGGGTAIALCGGGDRVAAIFTDRRILVWDKREGNSTPVSITSNHLNFRRATISNDGKYLCADCGSDGITIFSLPGGQAVKTITALQAPSAGLFLQQNDRRLIILSQNGKGIVCSFPGGAELTRFDTGIKDCSNAVYDSQTNTIIVISRDGSCMVYDIGGNRPISGINLGEGTLAVPEAYSRNRLALITKGETFSLVNTLSGKPIHDRIPLEDFSGRRIIDITNSELYALGTLDGEIHIYDPGINKTHAVLSTGSKAAITGLRFDEKDKILYACNASGNVRSWDFGLFYEMTRVLPLMSLPGINRLNEFTKKYPEPGVKAAAEWLKTVIEWRRRFDIELDFE